MVRILASVLGIGLPFGTLGAALIWWGAKDPTLEVGGAGLTLQALGLAREDAASASYTWWLLAITVVAVAAFTFLVLAQSRRPCTPADERKLVGPWLGLLILAIVGAFAPAAAFYPALPVAWRFGFMAVLLLSAALSFWLITALGVKNVMIPSVPLAHIVRR